MSLTFTSFPLSFYLPLLSTPLLTNIPVLFISPPCTHLSLSLVSFPVSPLVDTGVEPVTKTDRNKLVLLLVSPALVPPSVAPHFTLCLAPLVLLLFLLPGAVCDGASPPLGPGDMPVQEMAVSPVKSLYWEKFPPMTQRRVYCTPVYHEGLLYVLGGCSETGMPLDSVEVLDVESQTWSQLPPLPTARAGASAVALGGQVMVLGGMNQQQTPLASVEMYHPDEGKWETKASLGQPSMGATTIEKGKKVKCMFVTLLFKPNFQHCFHECSCTLLQAGPRSQTV